MLASFAADWPIDLSKILTYAALPRIVEGPRASNVDFNIQNGNFENNHNAS
jgi:hypothetical protein